MTVNLVKSQEIPIGKSEEVFYVEFDSLIGQNWTIGYYKPSNYNPLTSEMIIYFHGTDGDQNEGYSVLKTIADRRGALIVSPTGLGAPWTSCFISKYNFETQTTLRVWLPILLKQLYKHILIYENRTEIPVRITGFSAGAQTVTRYMLVRQSIQDSIPIKMAVSIDPFYYTFPTDTLNGLRYPYSDGLAQNKYFSIGFCSNSHKKNYYNENYTVLIGTADTAFLTDSGILEFAQGNNRYERAKNFYSFCEQDALERGTSLKWYYAEVPDVGHSGLPLATTKASPSDTVSICEHYLFDMPYHEPEKFPPTADFNFTVNDTTKCFEFSAECKCWWQTVPTTFLWDFGNGMVDSSITAKVNYTNNGTYDVTLVVKNKYGSDTITKQVVVENIPDIDFNVIDSIETLPNAKVQLYLQVFFPSDSVLWNFGDGTSTFVLNPSHTYTQKGIYPITLIKYRDQYCADTVRKTVRVIDNTAIADNFDNSKISIQQQKDVLIITALQEPISTIKLINVQGEVVYNKTIAEHVFEYSIPTSSLHGIYMCIVEIGNDVFVRKVKL